MTHRPAVPHLLRILATLALTFALALLAGDGRRAPDDPTWRGILATGTLRVATDPTYPPFASGAGTAPAGFDADLARALGARLGVAVVFVPTPFDNLYDALRNGTADATIAALTVRAEERGHARYTRPYLDVGARVLVRADAPYTTLAQLDGAALGAQLGSDGDLAARLLARRLPGLHLDSSFDSDAAALAALLDGRLDGAAFDGVTALTFLNTHPELRALPSPDPAPLVIAVPPDAALLQGHLDAALQALAADGTLDALARRWFR